MCAKGMQHDKKSVLRKLGVSDADIAEIGEIGVIFRPYGDAVQAQVPAQCTAFKPLEGAGWYPLKDEDCLKVSTLHNYCQDWEMDNDSDDLELMAADHNNAGVFCAWKMGAGWRQRAAECFKEALKSSPTPQQKPIIEKNLKNTQGQLGVTWQKTFLPTTYNKLSPEEKAKLMAGDIDGLHFEP